MKRVKFALLGVLALLVVLLLACYVNHRVRLAGEEELFTPLGQLVEVDGHPMSVYIEGEGRLTLVFLSGAGTCSPILDFRSLYTRLSGEYRVVVVEKFGYGFSDTAQFPRDLDTMLSQTRQALAEAGVSGPFVLCPHSMSMLEALFWARQYPQEVRAIVGLDGAVPEAYVDMEVNLPLMRLAGLASGLGVTRFIPGVADSDAVLHGTLTEREKEVYRAVFYRRTATAPMLDEAAAVKDNAALVGEIPQLPMLLFASDGTGTGFDTQTWRGLQRDFLADVEEGRLVELDCPHYVHNYEYESIAQEMELFLEQLPG